MLTSPRPEPSALPRHAQREGTQDLPTIHNSNATAQKIMNTLAISRPNIISPSPHRYRVPRGTQLRGMGRTRTRRLAPSASPSASSSATGSTMARSARARNTRKRSGTTGMAYQTLANYAYVARRGRMFCPDMKISTGSAPSRCRETQRPRGTTALARHGREAQSELAPPPEVDQLRPSRHRGGSPG